jgi:DNA polymerase elongation subunit (family B)
MNNNYILYYIIINMKTDSFFCYSWDFSEEKDENEIERTDIKIFGINEKNENIYINITDFEPIIYIEIPEIVIKKDCLDNFGKSLDKSMKKKYGCYKDGTARYGPVSKTLVYRKKLYYVHKDSKNNDVKFPYIQMSFSCPSHIKKFYFMIFRDAVYIDGVGGIKVKIHEQDASPILQIMSRRDLPSAGWIKFKGDEITGDDKESYCHKEYRVSWKNLFKSEKKTNVNPLVMSMDIEVNSSNPNVMPNVENNKDKIFQISCVLARTNEEEKDYKKIILSLGNPDQQVTGENVEIKSYKRECDLLDGYSELVNTLNPNIIIGYNTFGFDYPYMIRRSEMASCDYFMKQGFIIGRPGRIKEISWSSSAYKNQEFKFLDCFGILFIDLLPIVKRDFKFDNYRLKTVSEFFTGKTKDPLTPKDIFSCYRKFTPKSLGITAKYCVQDSALVLKLFDVLKTWLGLAEMAKTCNVPIITLFTQGQQIKIYSQVFKFCLENYVVEKDVFVSNSNEKFTGAYVFDPVPGLYNMVVPFDFSSLYPSAIIAYNIDYSTIVNDENIPDSLCHIIQWNEHKNCIHDPVIRKGKQKEDVTCHEYRYRFLKEPKGIIPTILQNMLDMRKKTNLEIKELKDKLKQEESKNDKDSYKIKNIKTEITVLDKRQLSYKVNANSMYGGMGVKRGYLPFLPGAMCTTAKGRESISKVAKYIQEIYGAKLIYGDSVSGDTPILVKYEDETIDILRIDEIGEVWDNYDEFKSQDSNRKEKQQTYPFKSSGENRTMNFIKVWTGEEWSIVKRVIRHKTIKKMYRVVTRNGCVDVTEDHSLLDEDKKKIKPTEINISTKLYHSFPPIEDFVEMEITKSVIEGKVYECFKCKEYKLVIEFDEEKYCKECKHKGEKEYFSETEYLRNPSNNLDDNLAYVWGSFMAQGIINGNEIYLTITNDLRHALNCIEILRKKEPLFEWTLEKTNFFIICVKSINKNFILNKYKKLFYDKSDNKKIPYFILNGSDSCKKSFLSGYGFDINRKSFKIYNKSKIQSHGFYVLLKSLGYKVIFDFNTSMDNIIEISNVQLDNKVTKIFNLPSTNENEYVYDIETESGRFMGGIGSIVLKNTDSCYVNFPMFSSEKDSVLCYDFCKKIEDEMLHLFPKPMKLAFEEKIYWRFFILTKKRYMALTMDRTGKISENIFKRGVLLNRRDNSKFVRDIYSETILKIFYKEKEEVVLNNLLNKIEQLYSRKIDYKDMVVTKSVGAITDYKIKELNEDEKKCKKRLVELLDIEINDKIDLKSVRNMVGQMIKDKVFKLNIHGSEEYELAKAYIKKCLPSQVQLSLKMGERGKTVDPGTRMEYVITKFNDSPKLFDKVEDIEYFKEHSQILEIDNHYYIKLLSNPIDQLLSVAYGINKFVDNQYKLRINKMKIMNKINEFKTPNIQFVE